MKTYGYAETEEFYFYTVEKAVIYAEKWMQNGTIQGYQIFNASGKLAKKVGTFQCLDWDEVDDLYHKQA